jgi:alkylhydroperoxidase family enzyme
LLNPKRGVSPCPVFLFPIRDRRYGRDLCSNQEGGRQCTEYLRRNRRAWTRRAQGEPTGDAKRDALIHFVRKLAATSGTVSDDDFAAIKAAGYSDAQLVDISLAFATTDFTNVFNRINDTDIDFPAAA